MHEYLDYIFEDTPEMVSTFDEIPLWSAAFGLLLFKHLELGSGLTILDIGSGTGFPLLELAARCGPTCKLYGIDNWANANARAKLKIKNYGIGNVEILETSAEHIPFEDNTVDLVVSNLGINNFENPGLVFKECSRVLKPGGRLALTTNLNGHWSEFYRIFEDTLRELGKENIITALKNQEQHRGSVTSISGLYTDAGFGVSRYFEEKFEMRFLDGTALLNHHFVKLGWLNSWLDLLPKPDIKPVFLHLEENLNLYSRDKSILALTVPMLYIEGRKLH